jgi:hypothetical protein
MSVIRVTGDLNYDQWIVENFFVDPRKTELQIGFRSLVNGDSYIEFNNLKFGFFLYYEGQTIQQGSYPPVGIKLISSDQEFIEQITLNVQPDKTYQIHIWAENAGKFYDHRVDLEIPRYEQPFASWIWNGTEWVPPTPYPDDGELYVWEEDKLSWVLYDPTISGTLPE